MARFRSVPLPLAPLLSLVVLATGCHTFSDAKFNDGKGAAEERALLVPFAQSSAKAWYGESAEGKEVIRLLREWADKNDAEAVYVEEEIAQDVLYRISNWTRDKILIKDWVELGGLVGARFVVEGDILSLTVRDPKKIGFFSPKAVVRYRVIDVAKGEEVWSRNEWEIEPEKEEKSRGEITSQFEDSAMVRRQLLAHIARRLGEELYGYYE